MNRPETLHLALLLFLSTWFLRLPSVSSSSSSSSVESPGKTLQLGARPDAFVQAAPLIVAAVCADGDVAIIAAHTSDEDEPLLYWSSPEDGASSADSEPPFLDLPEGFAGPFRIQSIDADGHVMVATGWRADCDSLVARCRAVAAAEKRRHGGYVSAKFLAREVSLYMAQCATSDRVRALSSLGLLVSPKATGPSVVESSPEANCLWLLDPTEAYPVRAMCAGGGLEASSNEPVAKLLQRRLRETVFTNLSAEEGLKCLVRLLSSQSDGEQQPVTLLKRGTRLECAIVDSARRQMIRKHIQQILPTEKIVDE